MSFWRVSALNLAALVGGIAAPWIFNWIAISKDEKSATQCGWGHLWKRIVTLLFALYGMYFFIYIRDHMPQTQLVGKESELAWGIVMKEILPAGVGLIGLLIASFFAAAMSSADTYATTSSAMLIDYFYRRVLAPGKTLKHYLAMSRVWVVTSIVIAALTTLFITGIVQYVELSLSLLCFLGVPIYFGIAWRGANTVGMWCSLLLGVTSYVAVILVMSSRESASLGSSSAYFVPAVFVSTALSLLGMWLGSLFGPSEDPLKLKRFYVLVHTPVGQEQRLVDAGISVPSLIDAGLIQPGPERLNAAEVERLYEEDAQDKYFGADSLIELRRERTLPWYLPGFIRITLACFGLVLGTWLVTRILFVWTG